MMLSRYKKLEGAAAPAQQVTLSTTDLLFLRNRWESLYTNESGEVKELFDFFDLSVGPVKTEGGGTGL